jgi:hypothetical protein
VKVRVRVHVSGHDAKRRRDWWEQARSACADAKRRRDWWLVTGASARNRCSPRRVTTVRMLVTGDRARSAFADAKRRRDR